jgi:transposase
MAIADGASLPVAVYTTSASPHEVTLVEKTIRKRLTKKRPNVLIGDRAYDSDPLDERLKERCVELIAPHKCNRVKKNTQDGRKLRRYKRRWKVERLFAWLQQFRRISTRFDYHAHIYEGFIVLGSMIILLRNF